jgi:DNA-binding response OmpR family regulator
VKILLLSGTAQARDLASRLVAAGHDVTASLAGATRAPLAQGCETRVGGFGGDAGFKDYLDREAPDLVILDVNLPGCSGLQIVNELRAHGMSVPVLMLMPHIRLRRA